MDLDRLLAAARDFTRELRISVDEHALDWQRVDSAETAMRQVPIVQAIARAMPGAPGAEAFLFELTDWPSRQEALAAGMRLEGALILRRDLADAIEEVGPSVTAERFHSWAWGAAESLWKDGHHRQAILAAATQIDLHLQAKLGRYDLSGLKLVREAFSLDDPQPGRPRLRFTDVPPGSETYKSVHDGARDFGAGCSQFIRNTAAHTMRPLSEEVAIEHLASLSLFARMVSVAEVVVAPGDHVDPD